MIELCDKPRVVGWLVASHNDYLVKGGTRIYWSFRRGNMFIEGDGTTDQEALEQCWYEASRL
jgi:hypothetical protein